MATSDLEIASGVSDAMRQVWLSKLEIDDKPKGELLSAIAHGETNTALQLLDSGKGFKKDVRTKDVRLPTGLTALHLAALFNDTEIFSRLMELNADANVTIYCQITSHSVATKFWMDARPLLFAIGAKNQAIAEQLLEQSTSITMNDAWPLFSCEWWQLTGRFDWPTAQSILKSLLQHKLDINHRVAILKWSMLHYCVNMEPRTWEDVEAFLQGRYDTIDYLLHNGADPLLKDTFGRTAFVLLEERTSTIPSAGLSKTRLQELERTRTDADERLKELLHKAMVAEVDRIKSKGGFRGSLQRLAMRTQLSDRIPLLARSASPSFRTSSIAPSTTASTVGVGS